MCVISEKIPKHAAVRQGLVDAITAGEYQAGQRLPSLHCGCMRGHDYPTINSKGISCFPKSEHGAVSGVILFFTCVSAALGPLAMGAVSDAMGSPRYGFMLAAVFAGLLFVGLLLNWIFNPTRDGLNQLDHSEYETVD